MDCLTRFETPQLRRLHRGKVRDSFRVDDDTRLIVATDRISAFDRVLDRPIPGKGEVLNRLSAWWFERCADIADHHLIRSVGPCASLVREAQPIRVEMIVRGYLAGSMWRGYQKGKRSFSGVCVPDGLSQHQPLPEPIVTPTTKEDSDREADAATLIAEGWVDKKNYDAMHAAALQLFARGQELARKSDLLLVDAKYEFGLVDDKLIVIDEMHTPDSARYWDASAHAEDPTTCEPLDKEYLRRWILAQDEPARAGLPEDVVAETSQRYRHLYRRLTGQELHHAGLHTARRQRDALVEAGLLKDGCVSVVMGSPVDLPHCQKVQKVVESYDVACVLRVMSAHKNGEAIVELADLLNHSIEPGSVVAVAGRSNGLGGALAANLTLPVLSAPPFKDQLDMLTNITSSLMMPSRTPAATVIGADSAAMAALRNLNLPRLRQRFAQEIAATKAELRAADLRIQKGQA